MLSILYKLMEYRDTINYALLALIIALIIHLIFKTMRKKKKEYMNNTIIRDQQPSREIIAQPTKELQNADKNISNNEPSGPSPTYMSSCMNGSHPSGYDGREYLFTQDDVPFLSSEGHDTCTVPQTQHEVDQYIIDNVVGGKFACPKKPQTESNTKEQIDKFRKDFCDFRGRIYNDSHQTDSVDKVLDLYLSGNSDVSRMFKGSQIRDMYDNLTTSGQDLYERRCARTPDMQALAEQGFYSREGEQGKYLTRNEWKYPKENIMNGGEVDKNLYGYDPNDAPTSFLN